MWKFLNICLLLKDCCKPRCLFKCPVCVFYKATEFLFHYFISPCSSPQLCATCTIWSKLSAASFYKHSPNFNRFWIFREKQNCMKVIKTETKESPSVHNQNIITSSKNFILFQPQHSNHWQVNNMVMSLQWHLSGGGILNITQLVNSHV